MKKIIILALFLPLLCCAQSEKKDKKEKKQKKNGIGIGIKAGLNFANVTNASSINSSSHSGFQVGAFLAPQSKGVLGYRTEIIYSKQGYNYKSNSNTGSVNLDYIIMTHLMAINITKYVQLQFGTQIAILLNAKADSSNEGSGGSNPYGPMMDYYNKFDYGFAGGIELHPVKGLLIGARLNVSMGKMYKDPMTMASQPNFIPKVDVKNNVVQIFAGWRF
jgi:hypothetical protein